MPEKCERKNPLVRKGTSQGDRRLEAFHPNYFKVDERSLADLIIFSQRFSKEVRHYDNTGQPNDWLPFFNSDITSVLAGVSQIPVSLFWSVSSSLHKFLESDPQRPKEQLLSHFKLFFLLPTVLFQEIGIFYDKLPNNHPLKLFIENAFKTGLETAIPHWVAYYKGAVKELKPKFKDTPFKRKDHNIDLNNSDSKLEIPSRITERMDEAHPLSSLPFNTSFLSLIPAKDWNTFYKSVKVDSSPYTVNPGKLYEQIRDALNNNLLNDSLKKIYELAQHISQEAAKYFEGSLTNLEDHEPHYGLWLTFLQLFKHNQDHINQFTQRHLDYYFQEILQISKQEAQPNKAHLLFTLNKNKKTHLLNQGTQFKAGKDSEGQDVAYQLDNDFVINKGTIEKLMSITQLKKNKSEALYASSITNSRDGQGQELLKSQPQWKPFGPIQSKPNGRLGFAIADRQLFLREGLRTITLTIRLKDRIRVSSLKNTFKVFLTSEEGWLEITNPEKLDISINRRSLLIIQVTLDGDDPPIIPFNSNLHEGNYSTSWAVARFEINQESNAYSFLQNARIRSTWLKVRTENLRNITAHNIQGPLDTSKPFLPFGSQPEEGAYFIFGNSELFSKPLKEIKFNVDWKEDHNSKDYFLSQTFTRNDFSFEQLKASFWNPLVQWYQYPRNRQRKQAERLDTQTFTIQFPLKSKFETDQPFENPVYSNKSSSGFVKVLLNREFGHKDFNTKKTLALINKANPSQSKNIIPLSMKFLKIRTHIPSKEIKVSKRKIVRIKSLIPQQINYVDGIPLDPYTPEIVSFDLTYSTHASPPDQMFHLYPFGPQSINDEINTELRDRLLPSIRNEGELYIGIKNLNPPEQISMLFQTLDGSSNPLKEEQPIHWHYLKGDVWKNLQDHSVDDKTNNLTSTGIIRIALPEEANTTHNILPSGLHWLRLSVEKNIDALNDLLAIDSQAATVSFKDQNNSLDFLKTPLQAETISKLKISNSAIKKIQQPNDSFGGKPLEDESHYYLRVSERLRHKDRASTIWDYEHLILEQFPEIYKVRCINHATLQRNKQDQIIADNGLKPGHVLIVPIPYLNKDTAIDPCRPYTHKKLIVAIEKFLKSRTSPFVNLKVANPKIEAVQVKFEVAFNENIADIAFYIKTLQTAIKRYLTPWAYSEGKEINFGGKWHKSSIINFVEEQHYVNFIKEFQMFHIVDIDGKNATDERLDTDFVEGTSFRSILVSHYEHLITEYKE